MTKKKQNWKNQWSKIDFKNPKDAGKLLAFTIIGILILGGIAVVIVEIFEVLFFGTLVMGFGYLIYLHKKKQEKKE